MATVIKANNPVGAKRGDAAVGEGVQDTDAAENDATILAALDELIATGRRTLSSLDSVQERIAHMRHVLSATKA